jgi:hypothetical protein
MYRYVYADYKKQSETVLNLNRKNYFSITRMNKMKNKNRREPVLKKGYVFIILISLFIAISQSLKYRLFIEPDLNSSTLFNLIIQTAVLLLLFLIPGLLLVRWYYKIKNK